VVGHELSPVNVETRGKVGLIETEVLEKLYNTLLTLKS
jgi:hypothetical protein